MTRERQARPNYRIDKRHLATAHDEFDDEQSFTSLDLHTMSPQHILRLQQTIGNHAVQRLLQPMNTTQQRAIIQRGSGFSRPKAVPEIDIEDDIYDDETYDGDSPTIIPFDTQKPKWGSEGQFQWHVGFVTNASRGYLVQKIENTYDVDNASGKAAAWRPTPVYWERWKLNKSGLPKKQASDGTCDHWTRPKMGAGSSGNWSMTATLYYVEHDYSYWDTGVPDAWGLEAKTEEPDDLGPPLYTRFASGTWKKKKHKGNVKK